MRKTVNLVLAAGLAASAFASTAAAPACANPDDLPVIDLTGKDPYTETVSYIGTPITGLYTGPDYVIDLKKKSDDVTFTISWGDGLSDYDLIIEDVASGAEIVAAAESSTEQETATAKINDCQIVEVGIYNFVGNPITDIDLEVSRG